MSKRNSQNIINNGIMKIDELVQLNAELSETIGKSIGAVSESLSKTKFKKTSRALLAYIPKAGYINSSILNCCATQGGYAAGTLFRSLAEHTFRHLYIYTRALKEDSDDVGDEYYGKLKGSEDLESFTKINNYTKVVRPDQTAWSTKGDHNKDIADVGKKFGISNIFFYLIENSRTGKAFIDEGMKDYLLERLKQYTNLSSYVHGGPYAEMCYEELIKDPEKMKGHLEGMATESFRLYKSIVEVTYLFSSLFDEQMTSHYESIHKLGEKK